MTQSVSEPTETRLDPMNAKPQKQHEWLQKLIGEWTYETEVPAHGNQPASKTTGTESVRSLGGLWVLAEAQGKMPGGGQATSLTTLGYDTATKRFVGTWIGSMMAHLWIYDGELDPAEKVLTLSAEGPTVWLVTQGWFSTRTSSSSRAPITGC
jgi:hypothetical protein